MTEQTASKKIILINCKPCLVDRHEDCDFPEKCLCAVETKHNEPSLRDGVKVDHERKVSLESLMEMFIVENGLGFEDIDKIGNVCKVLNEFYNFKNPYELLLYDGMIYNQHKAEKIINRQTERLIPNCTKNNRKEVLSKMEVLNYVDLKEFDADPNKLTLLNGILDISTLELLPHTADNLSKILYPLEYTKPEFEINDKTIFKDIEKNLKDTLFWKYITSSFTINRITNLVNLETVLENIACVFIKRAIDDRAFIHLGGGNNGKSVLMKYIQSLLSLDNFTSIPLQTLGSDVFAIADLEGMSACIYADLEENALKVSGSTKNIIGGEPIRAQKKYGQGFTLISFAKFIYSCNRFPKVFDQSEGFFRRWIIIKWDRDFENDPDKIQDLDKKLINNTEEKNKVFSCLVYLSKKIHDTGKFTHTKPWRENQKEWNTNAQPLDSFIESYIIEDAFENSRKTKIDTYQFYKQTMYDLGELPLSMKKFGAAMQELFDDAKIENTRYWLNIDFKLPKQIKLRGTD